jgi:hydroxyacyl-ACP dehydratase HTD2-like protein with hotdog domain
VKSQVESNAEKPEELRVRNRRKLHYSNEKTSWTSVELKSAQALNKIRWKHRGETGGDSSGRAS